MSNKKKKSAKNTGNQQRTAPKSVHHVLPDSRSNPVVVSQQPIATAEPNDPPIINVQTEQNNLPAPLVINVKPEQTSLLAHHHIQTYLAAHHHHQLTKNDLTAVLRLSQHLRVFGLLSAVAYVNQANAQGGEVRERTVPVWESLLGQFMEQNPVNRADLMAAVIRLANAHPQDYMAKWRKVLNLSRHWNFWARAYAQQEEQ